MKAGSLSLPRRWSAHWSALVTPDAEGHTDCRTWNSRESQPGRSWCSIGCQHKGNRHRTNSTPRKDLGAVVQATAARVHNSNAFAFPVRVKQTGFEYFSQKLAASLLRAATASLHGECTRSISWAVPFLSAGVGRRVILEAWFSEAGIG